MNAAPPSADAGSSIAYTIVASTSADAPNPTLSGNTPAGATFTSLAAPAGWTCTTPPSGGTGPFSCTTSLFAAAAPATFTLTAGVPPLFGAGSINASVTISGPVNDSVASNNTASASTLVITPARLVAVKTVTASTIANPVVYTITVQNTGTAAQVNDPSSDEFVDTLPPQLVLVSATASGGIVTTSGNTVHWNGALTSGQTITITIIATVASSVTAGTTISNQGQVNYDANGDGINDTTEGSRPSAAAAPGATSAVVTAASAAIPLLDPAALLVLIGALALIAVARLRG
ncbi:MAG TPA: hypothetical protein VJ853_12010, partial [Thermoanaerobaculia bacterium]|nr:hypothetical protein [Thermoanaerobaculia bacterium]